MLFTDRYPPFRTSSAGPISAAASSSPARVERLRALHEGRAAVQRAKLAWALNRARVPLAA